MATILSVNRPTYSSKRTLEQLFNDQYWKDIYIGVMLNFYPFERCDINRIGYEKLSDNSNAEWDIDTICQFIRRCENSRSHAWLGILSNKKLTWDDNLIDKFGISSYDWVYSWLSELSNVKWTSSFIIKHKNHFDWGKLTLNPSISWSENLLFEVEDKVLWRELIGNPNVKWSKRVIERVNQSLETGHAYSTKYNFYKEYVELALSKGFKPFNTNRLLDNALQYLQQFNLERSDNDFYKTVWTALSKNPYIPWTTDDLRTLDKIDLYEVVHSKNRLPLEFADFVRIKEYFTKRHDSYKDGDFLLKIELENDSFWTPEHIKQLTTFHIFGSEKGYCSDMIAYNDSVRWNHELFNFIKDYGLCWDEQYKPLIEREHFFEFLMGSYGTKELLYFFNRIYDVNRTYSNKFTKL